MRQIHRLTQNKLQSPFGDKTTRILQSVRLWGQNYSEFEWFAPKTTFREIVWFVPKTTLNLSGLFPIQDCSAVKGKSNLLKSTRYRISSGTQIRKNRLFLDESAKISRDCHVCHRSVEMPRHYKIVHTGDESEGECRRETRKRREEKTSVTTDSESIRAFRSGRQ